MEDRRHGRKGVQDPLPTASRLASRPDPKLKPEFQHTINLQIKALGMGSHPVLQDQHAPREQARIPVVRSHRKRVLSVGGVRSL